MTFLLFQLGKDRYALEARRVAEVLPPVALKKIPAAAPGIAGVLNYHGSPVPVVDLGAMALGQPARARLSTRILLVRYAAGTGPEQFLGLLAEQATELLQGLPGQVVSGRWTVAARGKRLAISNTGCRAIDSPLSVVPVLIRQLAA